MKKSVLFTLVASCYHHCQTIKTRTFFLLTLIALLLTACTHEQEPVTPSQNRVGYSAWCTQVSYTHCEPLPKTGMPEFVSGSWEMNDGILQHTSCEEAPLAICNYVIPSDHYTVWCTARKDGGPEGFIIVFNYVDSLHYCQLNFGCGGNTQHAIEQISSESKLQVALHPGSVETGRWYDVRLTVSADTVKAWLDEELVFDDVLK